MKRMVKASSTSENSNGTDVSLYPGSHFTLTNGTYIHVFDVKVLFNTLTRKIESKMTIIVATADDVNSHRTSYDVKQFWSELTSQEFVDLYDKLNNMTLEEVKDFIEDNQ